MAGRRGRGHEEERDERRRELEGPLTGNRGKKDEINGGRIVKGRKEEGRENGGFLYWKQRKQKEDNWKDNSKGKEREREKVWRILMLETKGKRT